MRTAIRQGLFVGTLLGNVVLVLLTTLAYFLGWENAYWPIFLVWAALVLLLVIVGFLSRTPDLAPSGDNR